MAAAIGRHFEAGHGHSLYARLIGADENCAGAADDPEHFHGQRRGQLALRLHHDRHPAHDAVGFRIDGKHSAPGGGLLDRRDVAQQTGKRDQKRPGIWSDNGEAGLRRVLALGARCCLSRAGLSHDDAAHSLYRFGEDRIVAGERGKLFARLRIETAEAAGGYGRRHAVGLGKDDVKANRDGAGGTQTGDEIGDHSPRPRPLPDLPQAGFVDIDDDDRPHFLFARAQDLKQVERAQSQFFDRQRVGDAQRHKREQEQYARRPRYPESPCPARNALHAADTLHPSAAEHG